MLWQLHWQYRDGKTKIKAQKEINNSYDEMNIFLKETQKKYPLPDNTIWMTCNEKSKHFVFAMDKL